MVRKATEMKKLFRFHRGSLADSLATTIEVEDFYDLMEKIKENYTLCRLENIRIAKKAMVDHRLPQEWDNISFYVLADFDGYKGQCIGMCNFYEWEIGQASAHFRVAVEAFFKAIGEPFTKLAAKMRK